MDCTIAKGNVRIRVYWLIFFWPYSPSLCKASSFGMAFVSNCIMMDALMYGPRPAIIMEKLANAPPDKTFTKLRSEDVLDWNKLLSTCLTVEGSLKGTGTCAKI